MAAIGEPTSPTRRPFGVRLYLSLAFAAVALITAAISYLLVSGSGEEAASDRAEEITFGRAVQLADRIGERPPDKASLAIADVADPGFSAWVFDRRGRLLTPDLSRGVLVSEVPNRRELIELALGGARNAQELSGDITVVWTPVQRDGRPAGALLARAERPTAVLDALEDVQGDRLFATAIAVGVALLISFLTASAISIRIKRLARSAQGLTEGRLDDPLEGTGGRDEITDLGESLETMRVALRETFGALSSERDRLSAILDALDDAVIVVAHDGAVRFSNPAAAPLIGPDGKVIEMLGPWLRRAARQGAAEHDALPVRDRLYAVGARELPAEGAVLAVVRDRTDELRREVAEREFVSNAAHELRNPIAGISGAIEVLRSGAKDDPGAREHFLSRLSDDVERVSRLTESLLTLARMESVGEGGAEPLDVQLAMTEALGAVQAPDGIEVEVEAEPELSARGDPVLLRQVLVGLLTNAFKNTSPPGAVRLRARRRAGDEVLIEVIDTGAGIPADEVDRIFERFYRGAGSLEKSGFGLGLSIAKRMVDVMGGEIGVDSQEGYGSTFWVKLPAAKPAATPVA
jgi:signal transduction histidine kinase